MSAFDPALVRGMVLEWIGAVDHEATLVAWVVALVARCEALKLVTTREYTLTTSNDTDLCVHDIRERISTTYKLSGGDTITLTYSGVSK